MKEFKNGREVLEHYRAMQRKRMRPNLVRMPLRQGGSAAGEARVEKLGAEVAEKGAKGGVRAPESDKKPGKVRLPVPLQGSGSKAFYSGPEELYLSLQGLGLEATFENGQAVLKAVSEKWGLKDNEILTKLRQRRFVRPRKEAAWWLKEIYGFPRKMIIALLAQDGATVNKSISWQNEMIKCGRVKLEGLDLNWTNQGWKIAKKGEEKA